MCGEARRLPPAPSPGSLPQPQRDADHHRASPPRIWRAQPPSAPAPASPAQSSVQVDRDGTVFEVPLDHVFDQSASQADIYARASGARPAPSEAGLRCGAPRSAASPCAAAGARALSPRASVRAAQVAWTVCWKATTPPSWPSEQPATQPAACHPQSPPTPTSSPPT